MAFRPSFTGEPEYSKSGIELCIQDIRCWMTTNKLKLNSDKTELPVLNARHRPLSTLNSSLPGLISLLHLNQRGISAFGSIT